MPELNLHCLRLASNSPKVRDTLLKLDEQGVSTDATESFSGHRIVTKGGKKLFFKGQTQTLFWTS